MSPSLVQDVLPDSSVWIDHLRRGNGRLAELVDVGAALMHEFVLGELMLGFLPRHPGALDDFATLPRAFHASHAEVLALVRVNRLEGSGIGWVDAHIIASAVISSASLWTLDKRLGAVALRLGVSA